MNLPDVNVWLPLVLSKHEHHRAARAWLGSQSDPDTVHFCRATQQGLVRLLTTAAVLAPYGIKPLTNRAAWDVYRQLLSDSTITFVQEPAGIEAAWADFATRNSASPKLWMDAWLAAFAVRGGLKLVTFDSGYKQFTKLDLLLLKP